MDLGQIRENTLSRNTTPKEKARVFIKEKAVWKLSKGTVGEFHLPREVKNAIVFLEPPSEQQQQIKDLEARLKKYIEDKLADKRLGPSVRSSQDTLRVERSSLMQSSLRYVDLWGL